MAKKQLRKSKKPVKPRDGKSAESQDRTAAPLNAGLDREFAATILFCGFLLVYLFLFMLTETEAGYRLGIYLSLLNNSSIYWAYWTGSANGLIHFLDRWPIVLGVVFQLLIAVGLGRLAFRWIPSRDLFSRLEETLLTLAIGLSLISTATLLAGMLQIYQLELVCLIPMITLAVVGWALPKKGLPSTFLTSDPSPPTDLVANWQKWIWLAGIPFGFFIFWGSMISPWEFDVREYHLQVPKEWFQQGGVSFLPHNIYGNMPLGTEMHALFAMLFSFGESDWWWGALIGKTISGLFSVFNAVLIFAIGLRWKGPACGGSASLIYLATPWVTANSIVGYNEGAMAFYLLSALLVITRMKVCCNSASDSSANRRHAHVGMFFLLGFFIGSAIACKYTAVVFVAIPATIWAASMVMDGKFSSRQIGLVVAAYMLGILLTAGPWLVKNLVLIGNPFYPLLESVFQSNQSQLQIQQWTVAHSVDAKMWTFGELRSSLMSLILTYKWLSPIVFPFLLLAIAVLRKEKRLAWLFAWITFAFFAWWFLTHRLERFLLPVFPIVCLIAGFGFTWTRHRAWTLAASVVLIVGSISNFWISSSRLMGDVRIFASLESLDLRSPKAKDYNHPDIIPISARAPYLAWLNQNRPNARVLFLGECRPLTAEFEVIYNTCFDDCQTYRRLSGKSLSDLQAELVYDGITHLFVNWSELERLINSYGYFVNRPKEALDYRALIRANQSAFEKVDLPDIEKTSSDHCELFEIRTR